MALHSEGLNLNYIMEFIVYLYSLIITYWVDFMYKYILLS